MKERAVTIGRQPALAGVVTDAAVAPERPDLPACILINAGLVHRVGPNRLHVTVARHLASLGYRTLRLDLSGRGDSETRRDGRSFLESSPLEIQEAMNHLRQTGNSQQFVLMGICSGAINAVQTALIDDRVVGCVAIDPPAYPTRGYYWRYYRSRLLNVQSWANTLRGRNALGRRLGFAARQDGPMEPVNEFEEPYEDRPARPKIDEATKLLSAITDRGSRMLFVFSGSWSAYNYRNQFRDAFPTVFGSGRVEVEYYPDSDHTFSNLYNQQRLIARVGRWLETHWPAGVLRTAP